MMKFKFFSIVCIAVFILLTGCNTKLPGDEDLTTVTKTLSEPGMDNIPNLSTDSVVPTPTIESTVELPVSTPLINQGCQSTVNVTLENSADNPITDEAKILEILSQLSELEQCNLPKEEGWLHRYSLMNGLPSTIHFITHLTGSSPLCDLQLYLKVNNGNLKPMVLGDLRGNQKEGYLISLDEEGKLLASERLTLKCDLTSGYPSVGTTMDPHFISGMLESVNHVYSLLKSDATILGPGITGWFMEENGNHYFILQEYGENLDGVMLYLGKSEGQVSLKNQKIQSFFDLKTGRVVRNITVYTTMDDNIIRYDSEMMLDYYEQLPSDLGAALKIIEAYKQ